MQLQVKNLTKQYGDKIAVDHLNLILSNGIYGLLGANGAGKTTFMRLLCGLQKPTQGSIFLDGKPVVRMGDRYADMLGYLPQQFPYYPDFTAEEFLRYMAAVKGLDKETARVRCAKLLAAVGLGKKSKTKIRQFSGGMKQRLGIAQALLGDPEILIFDEPTAGLDPKERIRFRNLLHSFSEDRIVILSTHIVSDVENTADTILMMKEGKIVYTGQTGGVPELNHGVPTGRRGNLEDLYLYYFGEEEQA